VGGSSQKRKTSGGRFCFTEKRRAGEGSGEIKNVDLREQGGNHLEGNEKKKSKGKGERGGVRSGWVSKKKG